MSESVISILTVVTADPGMAHAAVGHRFNEQMNIV